MAYYIYMTHTHLASTYAKWESRGLYICFLWKNYVDVLTFSGHKLHALKGIGVLWNLCEVGE